MEIRGKDVHVFNYIEKYDLQLSYAVSILLIIQP